MDTHHLELLTMRRPSIFSSGPVNDPEELAVLADVVARDS
jgi:hypothetical protein